MRRWPFVALAALLLVAGAGVAAVSWRSADQLVHPARSTSAATPADLGLAYERVGFAAADGVPLVGWWIPADPSAAAHGTVLFLHGYGDSKAQALPLAGWLHNASYHVLAFDMRAHGESAGGETTVGLVEVDDVRGALAFLAEKDPAAVERVAVLGFSMGAATGINAAALDDRIDVIVSDSGFATLQNIASNSITHFTDLPKYPFGPLAVVFAGWMVGHDVGDNAPVDAIRGTDAPILVIQGLDDTIAYADEDGRALADAAEGRSELWLVPGASHVQAHAVAPEEYERRVLAFLDEAFSSAPHTDTVATARTI